MKKKDRTVLSTNALCPYCSEVIEVTVKRETLEPGKKAVTKDRVEVSKSIQTELHTPS